jgi:hypothetical protein
VKKKMELLMTMTMVMSENQLSQSQVHVIAFQDTIDLSGKKPV